MTNHMHRETGTRIPSTFYFAYGSNMNLEQMARRCPAARPIGSARLAGWTFRINDRGVATVVASPDDEVIGGLWEISERCLRSLDRYEGVRSGLYRRELLPVSLHDDEERIAIVYVAASQRSGLPRAGYLEGILAGAADFALPDHYCARLAACA